jgi:hypothetical protein
MRTMRNCPARHFRATSGAWSRICQVRSVIIAFATIVCMNFDPLTTTPTANLTERVNLPEQPILNVSKLNANRPAGKVSNRVPP